jgi:hypothetical protein
VTNLLTEYRKRRNLDYLPVLHDGLCFFNPKKQTNSPIIATTSLACRTFSTCNECDDKYNMLTVELFQPGYGGSFALLSHKHVDQSTDLKQHVNKECNWQLEPFFANSNRSLEFWLWDFCFKQMKKNNNMRMSLFEDDPTMKNLEEMAQVAIKYPRQYHIYYLAYEAFLISRKYMLLTQ